MHAASEGARLIAQAKQWPANLRMLDPSEAEDFAGLDGEQALLIIGFESAEIPQGDNIRQAVAIARDAGGTINEEDIVVADAAERSASSAGRQGAVGNWRDSFINAPYERNATIGFGIGRRDAGNVYHLGALAGHGRDGARGAGRGFATYLRRRARVLPVHPTSTRTGRRRTTRLRASGRLGGELEAHAEIKQAASDAVMAAGGTITHHHAVGRTHRPWYDQQRPRPVRRGIAGGKTLRGPQRNTQSGRPD